MLRLTSKKTLPILLYALDKMTFTQSEIRDNTGISIGRVNKIVNYLMDLGIAIKENAKYHILQPNRLAELVASGIIVKEYRTFFIDIDKKRLLKLIRDKGARLCLDSSAERFSKEISSETINVIEHDGLIKELESITRGSTKVMIYRDHLYQDIAKDHEKIITVIELIARGQKDRSMIIADTIWQTRQ